MSVLVDTVPGGSRSALLVASWRIRRQKCARVTSHNLASRLPGHETK